MGWQLEPAAVAQWSLRRFTAAARRFDRGRGSLLFGSLDSRGNERQKHVHYDIIAVALYYPLRKKVALATSSQAKKPLPRDCKAFHSTILA